MSAPNIQSRLLPESRALLGSYTRVALAYLMLVYAMWVVGIEGLYQHPSPFYALVRPAFRYYDALWTIQAAVVLSVIVGLTLVGLRRFNVLRDDLPRTTEMKIVLWYCLVAFLVAGSVAMIRGGFDGITDAYSRQTYEYVGDIGRTGTIRALFTRYEEIHPFLSMHAKVHPPGPIAILWMMSKFIGVDALPLSIATMLFGATSVIPFHLWVRDMLGARVAVQTTLLYCFMPTIVIFTATSADITFMPFTLWTLFFFTRSIQRGSLRYALAGGVTYALCSLISFSLISIGAFFGLVGLWKLRESKTRTHVFVTAIGMLATLVITHYLVYLWSGFNVFRVFELAKTQFDTDQAHLDIIDPRYPSWAFRLLNPMCWFYFAGLPLSYLCARRMFRERDEHRALFIVIGITLVVLDILYLARGEGERSAMYVMPFVCIPAGYSIAELTRRTDSLQPLGVTLAFLAAQCWATEIILYTYW